MSSQTTISIRLPKDQVERLDRLAHRTGSTRSFYIRKLLEQHIDELEENHLTVHPFSSLMADHLK